jgi:hypothetical protein
VVRKNSTPVHGFLEGGKQKTPRWQRSADR